MMDARMGRGGKRWQRAAMALVAAAAMTWIGGPQAIEAQQQEAGEEQVRIRRQVEAERAQESPEALEAEQDAARIRAVREGRAAPADVPVDQGAAEANDAAADDLDEIDEDALRERFRVTPNSFQSNSYIHFDEDGNVRSEQHNMSLNLNVHYDAEVAPRSYRNFRITSMITDAGEELNVQSHHNNEQMIHHHHHRHGHMGPNERQSFNLGFQVPRPRQPALRVRRLTGSVDVVLAAGRERYAVLGPVKDIMGKRVHIDNFPNSELSVSREGTRLNIQMNAELGALMSGVRFYTAEGEEVPVSQQGTGRSGETYTYYYQFNVPEDGQIVLAFLSETRVLTVPFELEDLPLPQQQGGEDAELVIHAEPENPLVRGDGAGQIEGDLDVRIE